MKLLLDTHSFLWFVLDDPKLSTLAKSLIENRENQPLLSKASLWEIAIKQSIGKLRLSLPFTSFITQQLNLNEIQVLNIAIEHLAVVSTLPLHHRDPFDRSMIAQAMSENISILSVDSSFDAYPIQRLW
jgi:PIN domain nuclease of toxin-antitoxin system